MPPSYAHHCDSIWPLSACALDLQMYELDQSECKSSQVPNRVPSNHNLETAITCNLEY